MKFADCAFRFVTLSAMAAASLIAAAPEVLVDNDQVRVLRVVDEPHAASQPHQHDANRVLVYLQGGTQQVTANGKKTNAQWKAGEVKWSPATGTHVSEITSSAPVTIIEVELKKPADPNKKLSATLDPLKVDPQTYHLEFENSQVRVLRVRMAPKHQVPMHQHTLNRVVVCLTDQNSSMITPDGQTQTLHRKAGEANWGLATQHKEANLSDQPAELVVIEPKN
jgi:quercetin dioxygenase-like cupin family protein